MKKTFIVLSTIFCSSILYSQVGVNTQNPLNIFHVDGAKDNPLNITDPSNLTVSQQKNDFVITTEGKVGIGITTPNESLDVNGKVRIRSLDQLTNNNVYVVYADENGVLGKTAISPVSKLAFYTSKTLLNSSATTFNNGYEQVIPIQSTDTEINTIGNTLVNNYVKINEAGTYLIGGSVNFTLSSSTVDSKIYTAINIQRSTDNGNTWTSISGARPVFAMFSNTKMINSYTLPITIGNLNPNDLIKIVFFALWGNIYNTK